MSGGCTKVAPTGGCLLTVLLALTKRWMVGSVVCADSPFFSPARLPEALLAKFLLPELLLEALLAGRMSSQWQLDCERQADAPRLECGAGS